MPERTYSIKLVCVNCGMKDFYQMPFGSEFMGFVNADDSDNDEREFSHIHYGGLKEETGTDHDKSCHNCGLPFLVIDFWDKAELPKAPRYRAAEFPPVKSYENFVVGDNPFPGEATNG